MPFFLCCCCCCWWFWWQSLLSLLLLLLLSLLVLLTSLTFLIPVCCCCCCGYCCCGKLSFSLHYKGLSGTWRGLRRRFPNQYINDDAASTDCWSCKIHTADRPHTSQLMKIRRSIRHKLYELVLKQEKLNTKLFPDSRSCCVAGARAVR